MALKIDWSSLDGRGCHVMEGQGFVINNYGHPTFIRYIEGHRILTLSYQYVDETRERGRRLIFFPTYGIHVQIPTELVWDDGTPLDKDEVKTVLNRICRTFEIHKKRPCRVVTNDKLYAELAAIDNKINSNRS
jgi:hypothetical protein